MTTKRMKTPLILAADMMIRLSYHPDIREILHTIQQEGQRTTGTCLV
jgi:hypothetical protein